jgi:hypothetical protein
MEHPMAAKRSPKVLLNRSGQWCCFVLRRCAWSLVIHQAACTSSLAQGST